MGYLEESSLDMAWDEIEEWKEKAKLLKKENEKLKQQVQQLENSLESFYCNLYNLSCYARDLVEDK